MLSMEYVGLGSASDVASLQKTLTDIAAAKGGDSKYRPDRVDGTMSMGTVIALYNVVSELAPGIPYVGDVVSACGALLDMVNGVPFMGDVVKWLTAPSRIDGALDAAAGISETAATLVANVKQTKGVVEQNAGAVNTALRALSLWSAATQTSSNVTASEVTNAAQASAEESPQESSATSSGYPSTAFTVYDPGKKTWRVFQANYLATAAGRSLVRQKVESVKTVRNFVKGFGEGFGEDSRLPVVELAPSSEKPSLTELTIKEAEAKYQIKITLPWYLRWQVWAAGGGLLAVGGGVAYAVRRK